MLNLSVGNRQIIGFICIETLHKTSAFVHDHNGASLWQVCCYLGTFSLEDCRTTWYHICIVNVLFWIELSSWSSPRVPDITVLFILCIDSVRWLAVFVLQELERHESLLVELWGEERRVGALQYICVFGKKSHFGDKRPIIDFKIQCDTNWA